MHSYYLVFLFQEVLKGALATFRSLSFSIKKKKSQCVLLKFFITHITLQFLFFNWKGLIKSAGSNWIVFNIQCDWSRLFFPFFFLISLGKACFLLLYLLVLKCCSSNQGFFLSFHSPPRTCSVKKFKMPQITWLNKNWQVVLIQEKEIVGGEEWKAESMPRCNTVGQI